MVEKRKTSYFFTIKPWLLSCGFFNGDAPRNDGGSWGHHKRWCRRGTWPAPAPREACYDDGSELYYQQPCYDFHEGLARICDKTTEKYGYIDREGNEVFPCLFGYAEDINEGVARVELEGQYGFIDAKGNCTLNLTK